MNYILKETVYIETSIIGYLTARATSNLIVTANMQTTKSWWDNHRDKFDIYISEIVIEEVSRGDSEMAAQRLSIVKDFPLLEVTKSVDLLASEFIAKSNLPPFASYDAFHIAIATINELDYLLTWNCKHIANPKIQRKLTEIAQSLDYKLPTICTPYQLQGE